MSALPPDGYFCCVLVSIGTTAETLSEFLRAHGVDVSAERIVISDRGDSAMVSVPNPVLCCLLAWAIDGDYLGGIVPAPQPHRPRRSLWA